MAENEGGDSKFLSGFLVGFLVGVLIALGGGGSLVMVFSAREARRAEEMVMRAREAEQAARHAALVAEAQRERAEKLKKEAKDKDR